MTDIIEPNEEIRIQDGSKVDLHFQYRLKMVLKSTIPAVVKNQSL